MIASKLKRSILRSGYLVTPAWRSWRTNGTAICEKPIQTVIPRRKRLRSGIASSASQRLAVHQAEVAGLDGEVEAREAAEGAVEAARGDALEGRLPQPLLAHGVDDVDPLAPALEHLRDHLGRVLEVAVEHHDHVAAWRARGPAVSAGWWPKLRASETIFTRGSRSAAAAIASRVPSLEPSLTRISS